MRGRQFVDALVDRKRRGHVIKRKILPQRLQIQRGLDGRVGQQHFWLGRKQQRVIKDAPVERLFAEPIARDEKPTPRCVPQREREHAVEMLDHLVAVLFVKVRQDFGV